MHSTINQKPLLIIGGGIGGLMLALALAKHSISSLVLEQSDAFRESGAGILLCPNVFKVFKHLGLNEAMTKIAFFPENLIYADGITGFKYLTIPMGKKIEERFHFPYGSFHREELLHVLIEECHRYPQIQLVASARVVHVEERGNKVFAETEKNERYEGEALVGCDGLWSLVRPFILGNEPLRPSEHITHRGIVQVDSIRNPEAQKNVIHWDRPDGHFVQYPIGTRGVFNIVAVYHSKHPEQAFDPQGDPKELNERFAGSCPEILELLKFVDTSRKWMLFDRPPSKEWSRGRMTLLGDAAHPTLPHMTQGAGMAIEDAVVLASSIAKHGNDYAEAFRHYQQERYLRTAHIQIFSRAYGQVHDLDGVGRELRNLLISERTEEENYAWLAPIYSGIELKNTF